MSDTSAADLADLPDAPPPADADWTDLPDAPESQDPAAISAWRAQNAGVDATAAAQALALSKKTGLAPQFVASQLPAIQKEQDRRTIAASLARAPATAAYAGQSAVHAAAIHKDVGFWESLEQGFSDVAYGAIATAQMTFPSAAGEQLLQHLEMDTADIDSRKSRWLSDIARAAPALALYMTVGAAGKAAGAVVGGKAGGPAGAVTGAIAGELSATAATMYAMNRGVLYRRIMAQEPIPVADEFEYNPEAYEARARKFATEGGLVSAAIGTGLSHIVGLAVPGGAARIQGISTGILARAFADPVTQALAQNLSKISGKTLSGALLMAVPAVLDDDTVRNVATGRSNDQEAMEAGWQAFKKSLLAAGLLAGVHGGRELLHDVGAAHAAKAEQARLDTQVETAKKLQLVQHAPAEAEQLIAQQAAGSDAATVYIDHEALAANPSAAMKVVEALADEGQALAEAKATGADVAVPVEKYLTQIAPEHHAALREDVKLSWDGMTPKEATKAQPETDQHLAVLQEPITLDRLNEVAARGAGAIPSEREINGVLGKLRELGFDAPDVEPVKVQGLGADAPAGAAPGFKIGKGGRNWYLNDDNIKLWTGSLPTTERPASIAHIEVNQTRQGTATAAFDKTLQEFAGRGIRDFVTTGQTSEGEGFFKAMEARGRIERTADLNGEPHYKIVGAKEPAPISRHTRASAEEMVEAKTIGELQPGRYELAARRAEDKLAAMAADAAKSASKPGQEVNATVRMAKTTDLADAKDLARAVADHMTAVKEEMDKARKYITSRATPENIALLAKAGPEYEGAFRNLIAALGDGKADPVTLDALMQRMANDAEQIGFDPGQVRDLMANPRDWSDLKPAEARNLLDAVKNIRAAAHHVNEIAISDRKQSLRDFVGDVKAHLDATNVPDSGLPAPSHASAGPLEKVGRKISALSAELLQPREILRRLGPAGDAIYRAFVNARNTREELARTVGDHIFKAYQQMPAALKKIRFDGVDGPGSPVVNDAKWTRQDLWNLLAWMGNDGNKQRALDGLKITEDQARTALEQLSAPEVHFVESLHQLNDEKLWPLIRDHTKRVTGTTPPKVEATPFTLRTADGEIVTIKGGYWPARYNPEISTTPVRATLPEGDGTIDGYWGNLRDGFSGTAKGFIKERAQSYTAGPDLNWSMYAGHANSVLQYLAFDDFTRNVGRVFTDPEFRQLVTRRLGAPEMAELDKFASVAARGQVEGAQDGARAWGQVVGSGFRSRVATSAFGLNLPVVLGQLSHIPAAMFGLRINPLDMGKGVALAFSPEAWATSHAESEQLPYRWNNFGSKMREMVQGVGPGGDRVTVKRWIAEASHVAYHGMDGFLSQAIYQAAKSKAVRAGASPAEAARAGDAAISAIMPPLNIAEQSSLARDKGVVGSLLLVRNFPNVLMNVGAMNAWQARTQVWSAPPGMQGALKKAGAGAVAAGSYLGMTLSAHLFGRFLMGHGRQDDETPSEYLTRTALTAPFYPIPFGEEVAGPLIDAAVGDKPIKSAFRAAPSIALLEDGIKDLSKVFDDSQEDEDRIFAGARIAARALQLPTFPLKPGRFAYDLARGDAYSRGGFDVAGGLIYGQRDRQPKNPFTVAQDLISGE